MKQTIMRAVILGIVSLGTGLLYNYFHQPHLPVFAHNAEEIKSADSLALSGRLEQVNQPLTIVLDQAQNL
ncbi:MAG: hypothetical protein ISR91_07485, partial [Candidatus Delongbacteria bacterium]|nr:hypothetical protein [Candidatus Delongbacteria bacterium]